MKVLLIQPRPKQGLGYKSTIATEPLGLEILGAALKNHELRLVDMLFEQDIASTVSEFAPQAVGISCSFTVDVYQTLKVASQVKEVKKDAFVFVGGHHASLNWEDFRHPAVDAVVVGEGETTAPELLQVLEEKEDLHHVPGLVLNMEGEQFYTGPRPLLKPLDEVPVPDRNLTARYRKRYFLGTRRPVITMETSRGCPYRCKFCSIWRFHQGKVREMSPERVVEELSHLPPADTLITDDNFFANIERAYRIASLLERKRLPKRRYIIQARSDTIVKYPDLVKRWKKVGLDHVFIGFEKIDQEEMERLNKRNTVENNEKALNFLKSLGIGTYASFIVDPGFTRKEFQKLASYLKKFKIKQPQISILTPLPGTELFQELKNKLTTTNYELYDLFHAVLPTRLPLHEFYKEFARLYRKAYVSPASVLASAGWVMKKALSFQLSWQHLRCLISGLRLTGSHLSYLSSQNEQ